MPVNVSLLNVSFCFSILILAFRGKLQRLPYFDYVLVFPIVLTIVSVVLPFIQSLDNFMRPFSHH